MDVNCLFLCFGSSKACQWIPIRNGCKISENKLDQNATLDPKTAIAGHLLHGKFY